MRRGGAYARLDGDGLLFTKSEIPFSSITDGSSNTLLVGEVLGVGPGTHQGYPWVSHGVLHTANGVNTFLQYATQYVDNFQSGILHYEEGAGFSSFHPGGCHFVFADGSVHFVSESIDSLSLAALSTRAGEEVVNYDY